VVRLRVSWGARKPLKRLSPRLYQRARAVWTRVSRRAGRSSS
jgi:hypothetical protein